MSLFSDSWWWQDAISFTQHAVSLDPWPGLQDGETFSSMPFGLQSAEGEAVLAMLHSTGDGSWTPCPFLLSTDNCVPLGELPASTSELTYQQDRGLV